MNSFLGVKSICEEKIQTSNEPKTYSTIIIAGIQFFSFTHIGMLHMPSLSLMKFHKQLLLLQLLLLLFITFNL